MSYLSCWNTRLDSLMAQNKTTPSWYWKIFVIMALGFSSCESVSRQFSVKHTNETGITFVNALDPKPELNILNYIYYYNGAGVATADFNNDGLVDIFFTANQLAPELYLNLGDLKFVQAPIGLDVDFSEGWTNGVSIVDINNDGWMDLYLCRVGSHPGMSGQNILLVHQGLDQNNHPIFEDQAKDYGLDFKGYATQAAFFDYDLDGDLDVYLMNHSINPNQNYGKGAKRKEIDHDSGDKLLENKSGHYADVTESMGVFQGSIGYGLGLSISDYNNDGYPDIYIGNDFFENDYLYFNKAGAGFEEVNHSANEVLSHTTHYSMGNDSGDINNDGYSDIISVDMLPEDLKTYKTSGTEFNYQIYHQFLKNGYAHQFMQNTLQRNTGQGVFSEVGFASGIAATEWSWSPLLADFNHDGFTDLYITNGIIGATNDMDFINFVANEEIQRQLGTNMTEASMSFIKKMPAKHTANYIFENNAGQSFVNRVGQWMPETESYSNGAAYADLDNDGDLDLVVNNVNEPAFILENHIDQTAQRTNYLFIDFRGSPKNFFGIGTKVTVYHQGQKFTRENYTSRGYLSSVAPIIHFGLSDIKILDSLIIEWPDHQVQSIYNVPTNQTLTAQYSEAQEHYRSIEHKANLLKTEEQLTDYKHIEKASLDFNRDPLLPYAHSHQGPDLGIGDLNQDDLDDIVFLGAKGQATEIWLQQTNGSFVLTHALRMAEHAINEDTAAVLIDANSDGLLDIVIGSAGNEFKQGDPLKPRIYYNNGHGFDPAVWAFGALEISTSKITAVDLNQDGVQDLIFTAKYQAQNFGRDPQHYIFLNDGHGSFLEASQNFGLDFTQSGPISDVLAIDLDHDNHIDLVTCGPWNTINVWMNREGQLVRASDTGLEKDFGLWNTLAIEDFDQDGDLDILAGNWGLNTRWSASDAQPLQLYKYDFDKNQSEETLVTYFYQGQETPMASKEELVKQMPQINKRFLSFDDFANASLKDVFGAENLENGYVRKVTELGSCYFENQGDLFFKKTLLPQEIQYSSINDLLIIDLNNDGQPDVLPSGNIYEVSTQLGRLDAFKGGALINKGGHFVFDYAADQPILGAGRNISILKREHDSVLIMTRNNDTPIYLKKIPAQL